MQFYLYSILRVGGKYVCDRFALQGIEMIKRDIFTCCRLKHSDEHVVSQLKLHDKHDSVNAWDTVLGENLILNQIQY